jgi:carbon starvation protein
MNNSGKYLIWALLSVIGAFALGYIALNRGEQINALWIVVAAVCVYLIAYRFTACISPKPCSALTRRA